jgi:short-subunit dehydrogenase
MPSALRCGPEHAGMRSYRAGKVPLALVTGASSGIGEVTALKLARQGMRVVVTARRVERLQRLAASIRCTGGKVEIVAADLAEEQERIRVFQEVKERYGDLDILVSNAGLGWYGYYDQMPWPVARQMLRVNVEATVHLTRLFLPGMRANHSGRIIIIGSVVGQIPSQGVVVYSATKGFLDSFATALHRELKGSGVHLGLVCPGSVRTEFYDSAAGQPSGRHMPTEDTGVTAERVARAVSSLIRRPRRVVYVPAILSLTPWVEASFGWLMDMLGPLLLKAQPKGEIPKGTP